MYIERYIDIYFHIYIYENVVTPTWLNLNISIILMLSELYIDLIENMGITVLGSWTKGNYLHIQSIGKQNLCEN